MPPRETRRSRPTPSTCRRGLLTANGGSVPTGSVPSAMLLAPSGTALFVANSGTQRYFSLHREVGRHAHRCQRNHADRGMTPLEHGHGLGADTSSLWRIRDCRSIRLPARSRYSRFRMRLLTEVPGSPFRVAELASARSGPGPAGVAVTPDGKFLYVSNQFDSTVTTFSVDASGLLTRGPVVPVGTAPSALAITPDGGFLYVANSSTVSGFAICNQVVTSCSDPTSSGRHSHRRHGLALFCRGWDRCPSSPHPRENSCLWLTACPTRFRNIKSPPEPAC